MAAGGTSFGDIALVTGAWGSSIPKGIRDVTEWYVSTRSRRDLHPQDLCRAVRDCARESLQRSPQGLATTWMCSWCAAPMMARSRHRSVRCQTCHELWLPYYRQVNDWVHGNTTWKTFKHSCGAVAKFLPSFIDAGFDILNPVQCSAAGMDPVQLKEMYGEQSETGQGGVDTQQTLPFGTPQEVREQVPQRQ